MVVYRAPVVIYSSNDRAILRNEINALRSQIRYEKQNDAYLGLEVQRSLDDASMALDDAAQMLAWGYARRDVRAAIYDAEQLIEYARQERAYALESMRAYQEHAQAQLRQAQMQLEQAQYYAQSNGYIQESEAAYHQAQQAYEQADMLARAKANSDETLAAYKAAAERADSSMRALYASFDQQDSSFTYLRAEHEALVEWMNQVLGYAEQWQRAQSIQVLRSAKVALDRAAVAIENQDARTARDALDGAADRIDEAALLLSPED